MKNKKTSCVNFASVKFLILAAVTWFSIAAFFLTGCNNGGGGGGIGNGGSGGGDGNGNNGENVTIYTAGYYVKDSNKYFPCYWTGTTITDLPQLSFPTGINARVNATAFSEGTVYTAGHYVNSSSIYIACYWKNAVRTDLPVPLETGML